LVHLVNRGLNVLNGPHAEDGMRRDAQADAQVLPDRAGRWPRSRRLAKSARARPHLHESALSNHAHGAGVRGTQHSL